MPDPRSPVTAIARAAWRWAVVAAVATYLLLAMGPLVGYFGHGYFSALGAMSADLFPPELRTTAQGFCYNIGRAIAGLAPYTVGTLADRHGIGAALAFTSVFFVAGATLMGVMSRRGHL